MICRIIISCLGASSEISILFLELMSTEGVVVLQREPVKIFICGLLAIILFTCLQEVISLLGLMAGGEEP